MKKLLLVALMIGLVAFVAFGCGKEEAKKEEAPKEDAVKDDAAKDDAAKDADQPKEEAKPDTE
jgi:hypothetical protein